MGCTGRVRQTGSFARCDSRSLTGDRPTPICDVAPMAMEAFRAEPFSVHLKKVGALLPRSKVRIPHQAADVGAEGLLGESEHVDQDVSELLG